MTPEEQVLLERLAVELSQMGPMEMQMRPDTVLQLVGLLQLALRHPGMTTTAGSLGKAAAFITAAKAYFARCPATLEVIERGFDPTHDRTWGRETVQ